METDKKLVLGLFGFGVVGEGVYSVLGKTPSLEATVRKVCIKNIGKKRNAPKELFTDQADVLLNDPEINVIVEMIDDADAAFRIVSTAMNNGKHVVSASKKMIAEHLPELLELQRSNKVSFLYEAACCASIPVIRNLEEYYDNDLLHSIHAVVNGSTNFILTRIFEDKLPFKDALLLAQQLGFAESNPTLDVEGYDALNKWSFLLTHAYGILPGKERLVFTGIQNVNELDAGVAAKKDCVIRLTAFAKKLNNGKVAAFVLPKFVKQDDLLAFVKNEYNGVVVESSFADKQFFYGKGAGSYPTASAVLSDISALRYNYKYEYKKLYYHTPGELSNDFYLKVYVGFTEWKQVPKNDFESIEEWHSNDRVNYLVGIIHFDKLRKSTWWKENGVSLVVDADPLIESLDVTRLKKRSLELAGYNG
ncbi:MAG: homoserine dehydrogenase [Chitinophagaceae bacterium]|nr:homoserine dehydrogenase [Chitinophagaceae bacterium]MCW5913217.1 homoserine dehydrogenase [Chitinophagaceae bacterium]MCZ2397008.1 homoserine dehydrogenase [Chitinophagales bacterium]